MTGDGGTFAALTEYRWFTPDAATPEVLGATLADPSCGTTPSTPPSPPTHIQQLGDGVNGAVQTVAHLSYHGLEARVVDLPRPGLDKVDLDDYSQGWSNDLTPLLASAKPDNQPPAYDEPTAKEAAIDAVDPGTRSTDAVDTAGSQVGDGTEEVSNVQRKNVRTRPNDRSANLRARRCWWCPRRRTARPVPSAPGS